MLKGRLISPPFAIANHSALEQKPEPKRKCALKEGKRNSSSSLSAASAQILGRKQKVPSCWCSLRVYGYTMCWCDGFTAARFALVFRSRRRSVGWSAGRHTIITILQQGGEMIPSSIARVITARLNGLCSFSLTDIYTPFAGSRVLLQRRSAKSKPSDYTLSLSLLLTA